MFSQKFQLKWQGVTYDPITFKEIVVGQWEIEGTDDKGDKQYTTRKDYIFFSEYEGDWGEWSQVE